MLQNACMPVVQLTQLAGINISQVLIQTDHWALRADKPINHLADILTEILQLAEHIVGSNAFLARVKMPQQ